MQPNHELAGHPNLFNKKNLSNIGYKIIGKHIVYSDQQLGAVHSIMYKIETKIIKVGTIMPLSMMTMTCKIIGMFTISMGTLVLKCAKLIYPVSLLRSYTEHTNL